MPSMDQTLLATAISEIARNITTYAVRGEVVIDLVRHARRPHAACASSRATTGRASPTSSAR